MDDSNSEPRPRPKGRGIWAGFFGKESAPPTQRIISPPSSPPQGAGFSEANSDKKAYSLRIVAAAGALLFFGVGVAVRYLFFSVARDTPLIPAPAMISEDLSVSNKEPVAERIVEDAKVAPAPLPPPSNIPQLNRPIIFSASFSPEARALMEQKIQASIAALRKDPRLFDEWMQLAILRKTVDDYEGAADIWRFLTTLKPEQPGPYANLAALYTYELKDPALAEENFTLAIQKGPKELSVYRNAYDFYRYVREDDRKAKEILQNGIKETQSQDLQYLLDHYAEL